MWLSTATSTRQRLLVVSIDAILSQLEGRVADLQAESEAVASSFLNRTSEATLQVFFALLLCGVVLLLLGQRTTSIVRQAIEAERQKQAELSVTTSSLQFRNTQLNALSNVFTEITNNLSMHDVITSTLRETLRVMNASMVVLRLLQGNELVAVGNLTAEGEEIANIPRLSVGEGSPGRAALRGRSERTEETPSAEIHAKYTQNQIRSDIKAGLVSPLIIRARVIGTVGVWSNQANAFTDQDERVLEMMASQVATAIAAAEAKEASERQAHQDLLTGLPNRRHLSEDIANHSDILDSNGRTAVAMVDVDNFKAINDEFGHRVGDVSLQKIASILRTAMREGDVIYRYGGEEFVAIFKGASGQDALVAAERLRNAVETAPLTGEDLGMISPMTVSIGVALMPDHGPDISQLIEKADQAMYRAKDLGRNRVQAWEEELFPSDITSIA